MYTMSMHVTTDIYPHCPRSALLCTLSIVTTHACSSLLSDGAGNMWCDRGEETCGWPDNDGVTNGAATPNSIMTSPILKIVHDYKLKKFLSPVYRVEVELMYTYTLTGCKLRLFEEGIFLELISWEESVANSVLSIGVQWSITYNVFGAAFDWVIAYGSHYCETFSGSFASLQWLNQILSQINIISKQSNFCSLFRVQSGYGP